MFNQLVPCFVAILSDVNDLGVIFTSKQLINFIQSFSKDKEKFSLILILLFWYFPDFLVLETGIFNGGRSFSQAESRGLISRPAGLTCQRAPISCQNFQHLRYFALRLEPFLCGPLKQTRNPAYFSPPFKCQWKDPFPQRYWQNKTVCSPGVNNPYWGKLWILWGENLYIYTYLCAMNYFTMTTSL